MIKKTLVNLFVVSILGFTLLITSCSTNYEEKLVGRIWASTNSFFYGDYLWKFDGQGNMINLNYQENSKKKEAVVKYVIDGNSVKLTKGDKIEEVTIKFQNDNEFTFSDDKNSAIFRKATFQDSIIGDWDVIDKIDKDGFLTDIQFSPDNDCEFRLIGDNFYGDLYGGEFEIENNKFIIQGKEKNYGKNEKDYDGKFELEILSIDTIRIKQNSEVLLFTRNKF